MENLPTEYSFVSSESNVELEVSVENLGPENGASFSPVWLGFHDGSFDTFEEGETASSGIEHVAEDGVVGPGFDFEELIGLGVPPENLPPQEETIEGVFENSSAGENGGTQDFIPNPGSPGLGIFPGDSLSTTVDIDDPSNQRFFSYASMPFPTNDGFIADEEAIELFDEEGNFIGEDITVLAQDIWDAGTEVNDENPEYLPFTPEVVGKSIEENGTVQPHPGLQEPGSGGAVDFADGFYKNANFDSDDPLFQINVNPLVNGDAENNLISGADFREKIRGLEGDDLIYAEDGNDTVEGGQGDDRLFGNEGNDYLLGNVGNDLIIGDAGDDLIDGGEGNDLLSGRSGADQFTLRSGDGWDTITDYQDGIDSFSLADGLEFEQLTITQGTGETTVSIAESNEELAVLENTNAEEITAEDFI